MYKMMENNPEHLSRFKNINMPFLDNSIKHLYNL